MKVGDWAWIIKSEHPENLMRLVELHEVNTGFGHRMPQGTRTTKESGWIVKPLGSPIFVLRGPLAGPYRKVETPYGCYYAHELKPFTPPEQDDTDTTEVRNEMSCLSEA